MLLRSLCGPVFTGRRGWWTCPKSGPAGVWLLARCPPVRGGHPVLCRATATAIAPSVCVGWTGHIVRGLLETGRKGGDTGRGTVAAFTCSGSCLQPQDTVSDQALGLNQSRRGQ